MKVLANNGVESLLTFLKKNNHRAKKESVISVPQYFNTNFYDLFINIWNLFAQFWLIDFIICILCKTFPQSCQPNKAYRRQKESRNDDSAVIFIVVLLLRWHHHKFSVDFGYIQKWLINFELLRIWFMLLCQRCDAFNHVYNLCRIDVEKLPKHDKWWSWRGKLSDEVGWVKDSIHKQN